MEQERGCSAWDPGARGVCPLRGTLSPLQLFVSRRSFRSSFFSFKPAVKIRTVMSRQMKARNSHCHLYESWPQSSVTGVTAVQLGGRFARMEIRGNCRVTAIVLHFSCAESHSLNASIFTFKPVSQDWRESRNFIFLK